jgi:hypothetical protein
MTKIILCRILYKKTPCNFHVIFMQDVNINSLTFLKKTIQGSNLNNLIGHKNISTKGQTYDAITYNI